MENMEKISEGVLIYDIETKTYGKPDIKKDNMKIFGCYSRIKHKPYLLKNHEQIQKIINSHKIMVGFNNEGNRFESGYDNPILKREGIKLNYKIMVDLRQIFKNRASQMKVKKGMLGDLLMEYTLDYILRTLEIVTDADAKLKIDYKLFQKDTWTPEETKQIIDYTKRDIEITNKLYEWVEDYFVGFKDYLHQEDVDKKVYLTASMAKVAYKAICKALGWSETYCKGINVDDEGIAGGYVAYPAGEKFEGNIYALDYNSLYPHIMIQCNLYGRKQSNNLDDNKPVWYGNNKWKVEGTYYADELSGVGKLLADWYHQRTIFKKDGDRREYTLKIFINIVYGLLNNPYYEKVYDRVAGGDCTRIGRQWTRYARTEFKKAGYGVIYTDSVGKDSIIRTNKGNYTIEELFNKGTNNKFFDKEKVILNSYQTLSVDKNKKVIYDDIKSIIRHKSKKKKYKIYLNCYEQLIVTEDHSLIWFDDNGDYKECKPHELKNVIGLKNIPHTGKYNDKLSKELLMLGGYIIGNGNITKIKNQTNNKFYFGVSTGLDTDEFVEKIIKPLKIKYYIEKNGYDIKLNDEKLKSWFKNNGFEGTSKTKKIPEFIFGLSEKQIGYFLCGYFSADGCPNRGKPGIGSVNENLIKQTRDLLLMLGIQSSMKRDFKKNTYKGKESNTYNFWLTIKNCKMYAEKVGFIFDKQNKIMKKEDNLLFFAPLKIRNKIRTNGYKGELVRQDKTNEYIDVPIRRIIKIEEIKYDDYVYDIETKNTHMFFANDILVHNTDSVYIMDPFDDKEKMLKVKQKIIDDIKATVPFPQDTFDMGIDDEIKYMYFFKGGSKDKDDDEMDEDDILNKTKGFMKKNYIYVAKTFDKDGNYTGEDKVVIKNLGIKKKSNSPLSKKIFWDYLVPKIKQGEIKFAKTYIKNLITTLLKEDIKLVVMRKNVGSWDQYKDTSPTSMPAQIAQKYGQGIHFLIPNMKGVGIGKGKKFCTLDEFEKHKMRIEDIDLDNVWKELDYFIKPLVVKNIFEF